MYEFDINYGDECFDVDSIVSLIETQEEAMEDLIDSL